MVDEVVDESPAEGRDATSCDFVKKRTSIYMNIQQMGNNPEEFQSFSDHPNIFLRSLDVQL